MSRPTQDILDEECDYAEVGRMGCLIPTGDDNESDGDNGGDDDD